MRKLAWAVAVAFFFLNPGLACGPSESDQQFQFGAAELRTAVEGDWLVTLTPDGGGAETYHVHLAQAAAPPSASEQLAPRSLVRSAHACGSRTLVASASACVNVTEMPLAVTLAAGDPPSSGTPSGKVNVYGTQFQMGYLDLVIGSYHVAAILTPDGTVTNAHLAVGGAAGMATLARQ